MMNLALYRDARFNSRHEARYASDTYGRFLQPLARKLSDRIRAVDVGTGDGSFLHELLGAGFIDVAGIEPSSAPIARTEESVRRLIRYGIFRRNAGFSTGSPLP
jgi:hypothetical protein